jgi:NADH-quinone oxidoreductase subunit H
MAAFWTDYIWPLLVIVAQSLLMLVVLLIAIAYVLYADRKIWAAVQIRRGPNVVGPWGLLQSFADLLKFVLKEPIIPAGANKGVFLLAPLVSCGLALAAWASTASSWAAGRRIRNIRSWRRCVRRPRWSPTRSPSVSS